MDAAEHKHMQAIRVRGREHCPFLAAERHPPSLIDEKVGAGIPGPAAEAVVPGRDENHGSGAFPDSLGDGLIENGTVVVRAVPGGAEIPDVDGHRPGLLHPHRAAAESRANQRGRYQPERIAFKH